MSITITKSDIVAKIVQKIGMSHALCEAVINSVFQEIINTTHEQHILKIQNFGVFKLHNKNERFGLNISSKQPAPVKSRKVIGFLAAKKLKYLVNNKLYVV